MDNTNDTTPDTAITPAPAAIWQHFEALSAIPRISENEAGARAYVLRVADAAGAESQVDAKGNVVVRVPATGGSATDPAKMVALQSHLDMVPAIAEGIAHDFTRDPIITVREGDWLTTGGKTTLGADNGLGVALMLAFLSAPGVPHGPLELLFTVEEEIGLVGARELDPALVHARRMINLDNEDPHDILIGCAGGAGAEIEFQPLVEAVAENAVAYTLQITSLLGGHSGIEIHRHRANAIKLLARLLTAFTNAGIGIPLAGFTGGSVRNKIPEDGHATFVVAPGSADALQRSLAATERAIREEYGSDEPGFKITLTETHRPALVLTPDETTRLLALIADLPHGVQSMSAAHNAVETSCNLAIARVTVSDSASAHFVLSGRSLITTGVPDLQRKIAAIAAQHGVPVTLDDGYPAWEPRADSPLLATARRTYETVYGHPANVTVVHAGVECGTIISRVPGLDAIAIGPLIEGAHTPRERVNIPSVATIWTFLTALLRDLAK